MTGRKALQALQLAAVVAVAAWWLPADCIWPARGEHRTLAARLAEVVRARRGTQVVAVPGLQFPRGDNADREARFFVRGLLWEQRERLRSGSVGCVVEVVNAPPPSAPPAGVVLLHRSRGDGPPLYVVDRCDGQVRDRLARR